MLILMGIYAMYVGFLYNDQFSLGVDWFGTTWSFEGVRGVWSKRLPIRRPPNPKGRYGVTATLTREGAPALVVRQPFML